VAFLLVLLVVSLGLNVYQGTAHRATAAVEPPALKIGEVVPPLEGRGVDGTAARLTYAGAGRSTVLYVFSPSCPWCRRNLPNIRQLVAQRGDRYRFVGVSSSDAGLAAYVVHNGLKFPVYTAIPDAVRRAYKLGSVPQMLVIDTDGRVVKNWRGAFTGPNENEIEAFFSVELPGLAEAEPAVASNELPAVVHP
jgi:peroxiredoxin